MTLSPENCTKKSPLSVSARYIPTAYYAVAVHEMLVEYRDCRRGTLNVCMGALNLPSKYGFVGMCYCDNNSTKNNVGCCRRTWAGWQCR